MARAREDQERGQGARQMRPDEIEGILMDERRANAGLTDEQVRAIKEAVLASVYEDIGRSVVKKALWIFGSLFVALSAWLAAKGYISVKLP